MKRIRLIAAAIALLAVLFLFSPARGGSANILTGEITCTTPEICIHENAHLIDVGEEGLRFWDWKSADPDFEAAIYWFFDSMVNDWDHEYNSFMIMLLHKSEFKFRPDELGFWFNDAGVKAEVFADIFMIAEGQPAKMPPAFRDFFSQFELGAE